MNFLTETDLLLYMKSNVLNDITENNNNILDTMELISIETIKSYIGHYYDTDLEFSKTINRNAYLVSLTLDIFLYNLATRLTPTQIPSTKQERYSDVIKTLEKINQGKIVINLAKRDINVEPDSEYRFGSNPRVTDDKEW